MPVRSVLTFADFEQSHFDFFLESGGNVNNVNNIGQSILMMYLMEMHTDTHQIVKRFIKMGANVNQQDSKGWTALAIVMDLFCKESVKALLRAGVEPLAKVVEGKTALQRVQEKKSDLHYRNVYHIRACDEIIEILQKAELQCTLD